MSWHERVTNVRLSDVVLRTLQGKRRALTSYEIAEAIGDRDFPLGTQGGRPPHFRYPVAQVAAALRNLARQGLVVVERDGYTRLYRASRAGNGQARPE